MLALHTGKLAISAESSVNRQVSGMRLVYFALEQQHSNANHDTTYPLSRTETERSDSFSSFFEVNASQEVVRDLIQKWSFPCTLIGRGSGNLYRFATGLSQADWTQDTDMGERIRSYCEEYQKVQDGDVTK